MFFILSQFVTQFRILINELLEVGVVVADAPSLEHDDCNQRQYYHDDSSGEGNGENERYFHTLQLFKISVAKLRTASENDVSVAEKYDSN